MTLWNLVQQGIDVFCWCNRCNHHAVLPVRVLAAHMEPSTPVPAVAARVVCSGVWRARGGDPSGLAAAGACQPTLFRADVGRCRRGSAVRHRR